MTMKKGHHTSSEGAALERPCEPANFPETARLPALRPTMLPLLFLRYLD